MNPAGSRNFARTISPHSGMGLLAKDGSQAENRLSDNTTSHSKEPLAGEELFAVELKQVARGARKLSQDLPQKSGARHSDQLELSQVFVCRGGGSRCGWSLGLLSHGGHRRWQVGSADGAQWAGCFIPQAPSTKSELLNPVGLLLSVANCVAAPVPLPSESKLRVPVLEL